MIEFCSGQNPRAPQTRIGGLFFPPLFFSCLISLPDFRPTLDGCHGQTEKGRELIFCTDLGTALLKPHEKFGRDEIIPSIGYCLGN